MTDHTTTSNETPSRYRKKPVEITAIQWTGENFSNCFYFLGFDFAGALGNRIIGIHTLEGNMECPPGHWIIRGIKGEHYSCDPEIFALTYEPVTP